MNQQVSTKSSTTFTDFSRKPYATSHCRQAFLKMSTIIAFYHEIMLKRILIVDIVRYHSVPSYRSHDILSTLYGATGGVI